MKYTEKWRDEKLHSTDETLDMNIKRYKSIVVDENNVEWNAVTEVCISKLTRSVALNCQLDNREDLLPFEIDFLHLKINEDEEVLEETSDEENLSSDEENIEIPEIETGLLF